MTTKELEELLQGGAETQSLDFKGACVWSVDTFVKDLLAMANVEHGGRIVVGVEDGTFVRQGVTAAERDSYDVDVMKDQVAPYADPYVEFRVEVVADSTGKEYVVISVAPFDEVPTVCKRDGRDVHKGRIYYRSSVGRPQSAAVGTSYDMQNIILVATARMNRRLTRLGLAVVPAAPDARALFDKELGDL